MKGLFLTLVLALPLLFTGCFSGPQEPDESMRGTDYDWVWHNLQGHWHADYYVDGDRWRESDSVTDRDKDFSNNLITFNSNGTVLVENFVNHNGTWSYDITPTEFGHCYVHFGQEKFLVIGLDKSAATMTLANFAKIRKLP